jgi:hypothetical protein
MVVGPLGPVTILTATATTTAAAPGQERLPFEDGPDEIHERSLNRPTELSRQTQ